MYMVTNVMYYSVAIRLIQSLMHLSLGLEVLKWYTSIWIHFDFNYNLNGFPVELSQ